MGLYITIMLSMLAFGAIPLSRKISVKDSKGAQRIYALLFIGVLWFLLAFRGHSIGSDTGVYVGIFELTEAWADRTFRFWSTLFTNDTRYETGYIVYNRLIALLFDDPQWLFIITATFCMTVLYFFVIKRSDNICFTLFLFVSLRLYYFTMSGMRQTIAIFICVIAYHFIEKRKFIPFVLLVLLAMQFHLSAVLFLAAYPLSYLAFNPRNAIVVSLAGVAVFVSFDQILSRVLEILPDYYAHYTTTERFAENQLGNILVALIQITFLMVAFFSNYGKEEKLSGERLFIKEYDQASMMKYMVLVSVLLSLISLRATTLDRLFYYYWIFAIIYIPNMLEKIPHKADRALIKWGVVILTMAYNITILYYRPEWSSITPYEFFWQ